MKRRRSSRPRRRRVTWFGTTVWQGRPAFRISVSSWRTDDAHIDRLVALLTELRGVHVR